jgi:hypothetical protein
MAAIIKGTGVVWSVGAVTFTAGISSTAGTGHYTQSASIERTSEVARIKDTGGTVKTVVFSGAMKTLRVTVVPAGSTVANAITSGDSFLPAAGTKVSVTDDLGTTIDDNYNCLSATQSRTVDGVATIDLVLEAGDEGTELATDNLN